MGEMNEDERTVRIRRILTRSIDEIERQDKTMGDLFSKRGYAKESMQGKSLIRRL